MHIRITPRTTPDCRSQAAYKIALVMKWPKMIQDFPKSTRKTCLNEAKNYQRYPDQEILTNNNCIASVLKEQALQICNGNIWFTLTGKLNDET
jgi:hypothetical protein